MAPSKITAVWLSLCLAVPVLPAGGQCGCGGHGVAGHDDSSVARDRHPSLCCAADDNLCGCRDAFEEPSAVGDRPTAAPGCCGNACADQMSSPTRQVCRCGDHCRCSEANEAPQKDTAPPIAESGAGHWGTRLLECGWASALCEGNVGLWTQHVGKPSFGCVGCLSSAERCSQLCRFLR